MKKYIITISKNFPAYHIKKGQPTNFALNYLKKIKKHTIRGNYAFWKKRIDEVNAGVAQLEIRQWTGKPYASKQTVIDILFKGEVSIQKCNVAININAPHVPFITIDDLVIINYFQVLEVVQNDGLTKEDFVSWFKAPIKDGCIIHFTDLRYTQAHYTHIRQR
jgi:hypothetical protein